MSAFFVAAWTFIKGLVGIQGIATYGAILGVLVLSHAGLYLKGRMDGLAIANVEGLRAQIAIQARTIDDLEEAARISEELSREALEAEDRNNEISESITADGPSCFSPSFLQQLSGLN